MKGKNIFHLYAFTTALMWSLAYAITRMCTPYIPSPYIGAFRVCIAAVCLISIAFGMKLPKPKKKDIKWFIVSGASGVFLYMLCFNKGASMVNSATGNLILAVTPAVTAIGARILFKEKLSPLQWLSIAICFVGVVVLTVLAGGFSVNLGLMWLCFAMLLMATYNLMQKYLSRKEYPSLTITCYSFMVGAVGMLFLMPKAVPAVVNSGAPTHVYLILLVLGLFCSGLAYCSWTKAFSLADKASSVSNYMFTTPFIGSIFGYILVKDPIDSSAIIGGAVIMLGLALFNFGPGLMAKLKKSK